MSEYPLDWQRLSTHEHRRRRFTSALLPIGTIEAHDGGPVGTDNYIPEELCRRLSSRLEMSILPVMPYGITSSLLAYPGGCTLSPETLDGFLFDLGRSLYRNGLRHLFVIDGHGGNTSTLHKTASRLFKEVGLYVAVIDWWVETQSLAENVFGPGGRGHSAVDEMGMLLGVRPDVRDSLPAGEVPSYYNYKGTRAYPSPRPVITYDHPDDPVDLGRVTPEKCALFADEVTNLVEKIIRDIRDGWNDI